MDPARLTRSPIFAHLEPRELRRLAALGTEQSFAVGTTVLRQGDYATELYCWPLR